VAGSKLLIFDQPVRPGPPGNLVTGWSLANRKLVGTQEEHALHYTALHKDAAAFFCFWNDLERFECLALWDPACTSMYIVHSDIVVYNVEVD